MSPYCIAVLTFGCLVQFPSDTIGIVKAYIADRHHCFLLDSVVGNTRKVELPFHILKHISRSHTQGDMIKADAVGIKTITA